MNRRIHCVVWESHCNDCIRSYGQQSIGGHESFWIFIIIEEIYTDNLKAIVVDEVQSCYWMVSGIYFVVSQYSFLH
jgi:hypothetical protein